MRPMFLRATIAAASLAAVLLVASPRARADEAAIVAPPAARQHELLRLLHQDCGSCHGLRLTGGLGPALTRQALQDKPDESLVATIVAGRNGTPMPPWKPFMTEDEARWLVARLKDGRTDAK
jgi:cytochrome c55X